MSYIPYYMNCLIPEKYKSLLNVFKIGFCGQVRFTKFVKKDNLRNAFAEFVNEKHEWSGEIAVFKKMPPAVYCEIPTKHIYALINWENYPVLCQSLISYTRAKHTNSKLEKYLLAYKAYEGMAKNRSQELCAIRHALAHQSNKLTQQSTIKILKTLFGTIDIDLTKGKHSKVLYEYFAKLLNEVDELLYQKIIELLPPNRNLHGVYHHIHK